MKAILTITLFLFMTHAFGQEMKQKLIVAEFRIDTLKAGNYTYLVSYNFIDGVLESKDTILGQRLLKSEEVDCIKQTQEME